jgi:AAA+ superfamily predicted ATPase
MLGEGPVATRGIRVAPWLAPVLAGAPLRDDVRVPIPVTLEDMIGAPSLRHALARWMASPARPLVLVGNAGSGRRLWAAATLAGMAMPIVAVQAQRDPLEAVRRGRSHACWHAAALFVRFAPGTFSAADGEAVAGRVLAELRDAGRPVVLGVAPPDAAVLTLAEPALVRGDVGELTAAQRAQLWQRLLPPEIAPAVARELASTFAFRPEQMRRSVVQAGDATAESVRSACQELGASTFGELAERLPRAFRRTDLVVPDRIGNELDLATAWIRQRRVLLEEWGFGDRMPYGRGIAVLFAGRPGTGKTMAAQVLASELDMAIYRVNLARIVSKYVGETEKQLARLFDEARGAGAILFFDEADALFGKRGQVRDATDRWANLEIGYLLQRMEQHEGVSVLATNRHGDLDDAFLRRFAVSIVFPMPEIPERVRLWRRMLPERAPAEPDLPFEHLASYALSGGDIQTAAVTAAVLAAEARTPIAATHLYRGIHRVLVKNGVMPDERLTRLVRSAS